MYIRRAAKIQSEMEVALLTLFRLFTLLPLFTLPSQFKLLKQWHVWLYEQKVEWTGLYWTWWYPLGCYDYEVHLWC